jgi:hypothetical protein
MDVESGTWLSLKMIFAEKSTNKAKVFLSWKDQVKIASILNQHYLNRTKNYSHLKLDPAWCLSVVKIS